MLTNPTCGGVLMNKLFWFIETGLSIVLIVMSFFQEDTASSFMWFQTGLLMGIFAEVTVGDWK
jgi:hypothetical protein